MEADSISSIAQRIDDLEVNEFLRRFLRRVLLSLLCRRPVEVRMLSSSKTQMEWKCKKYEEGRGEQKGRRQEDDRSHVSSRQRSASFTLSSSSLPSSSV